MGEGGVGPSRRNGGRPAFLLTFLVLLVRCGTAEVSKESALYNTGATPVPGKLNVHLVPHTHDDLGWLQTADQYYVGPDSSRGDSIQVPAVQYILHTVIQELQEDPNRKFSYAEMGFFMRWWREQSLRKQRIVKQLVASGQLEFVNGGWCMHDEAATHYVDMIDQTTLGHRYLKEIFGVAPRQGWQIDPFGHSAVQAYLLGAEAGFDSIFAARIDYQDREQRKANKALEMIWRGSKTLGASSEIFMGVFPGHYTPPNTFEFQTDNAAYIPVQDDPRLAGYNIDQRVNDLVQEAQQQASLTRTNHIMWTMGDDFSYEQASIWFSPMDRLIHYANLDGRVNVLYSTPSIYLDSKHAENQTWPLKTGDFFPYADGADSFWTGYFTSRPAFKGYVRMLSGYLQAARQLEFFRGRQGTDLFSTDSLEEAMATAQHHDGVSGTSTQAVADDYIQRLYIGAEESMRVVNAALEFLTDDSTGKFQQCGLLNITFCPVSESATTRNGTANTSLIVVAYNSLAWARIVYVRIPVSRKDLAVTDSEGHLVMSQIVPISNVTRNVRNFYVQANLNIQAPDGPLYDLIFQASVPPLGFTTYTVGPSDHAGAAGVSSVEEVGPNSTTVHIGNGNLELNFSLATGELMGISNSQTRNSINVTQKNLYYESYNANGGESTEAGSSQSSGAYIFRPAHSKAQSVIAPGDRVSNTIVRGPLVEEIWQVFSPWVSQVMRVYKGQDHVEVEVTIGPIPKDDNIGKEVITRFTTNMKSNRTFYTDSNGRDFIERERNYRDSWPLTVTQPIAGNYYPINLGMYITDNELDFSVLVDRAVGGASITDGEMELMLHRRLLADDGRGVGEALDEEVCTGDMDSDCEGLTIRGRYHLSILRRDDAAEWRRTQGQEILSPLVLGFTTRTYNDSSHTSEEAVLPTPRFSAMAPNSALAPNVALITLQELQTGDVLLRLAHLYQEGEHPELSKLALVDLKELFPTHRIVNATEMSLTANQAKSDVRKLAWSVVDRGDGDQTTEPVLRGSPLDSSLLQVELAPMEIRTFIVSVDRGSVQSKQ